MARNNCGVVLGIGEFGFHIAKMLSRDGCEVVAVDRDEIRVNSVKDFVMRSIVADIAQQQSLKQVIPNDVDFVVVCIGNIETSMIVTLYLKDFGFDRIYVKAVTDDHERILAMLGVEHIIFPERDMAKRVAKRLVYNNLLDYLPVSDDYSIAEVQTIKGMADKTLKEIDFRKNYKLTVIAVQRKGASKLIFTPGANYCVTKTDILMVIGQRESVDRYNDISKTK